MNRESRLKPRAAAGAKHYDRARKPSKSPRALTLSLLVLGLPLLSACERDMSFGEQPDIPARVEGGEDPARTVLEAENQLREEAEQNEG